MPMQAMNFDDNLQRIRILVTMELVPKAKKVAIDIDS